MQVRLDGSGQPVRLANNLTLSAPGLMGYAVVHQPQPARTRGPALGTEALEAALKRAGWGEQATVELGVSALPGPPPARDVRAPGDLSALQLEVADPGPSWGSVVLSQDETGALSWHFPLDQQNRVAPPTRGGGSRLFRIPRRVVQPPAGTTPTRGLIGLLGRKLLKVLVYPVTDPVLGAVSGFFARRWEEQHRPYGVRPFGPESYRAEGASLTAADWERLQEGRSLLFIHGTFSRAVSAFGALPPEAMATLAERYQGRIWAFDHFTLSESPEANCNRLLQLMPPGAKLDVDIVCHSRGGLVARTLAEQFDALQADGREVRVGKVVFVATPNRGTILVDPEHMTQMLDRYTSALNLFPMVHLVEILDGLLMVVKLLGHGALGGLDGLAVMHPQAVPLNVETARSGHAYYALTADFDAGQAGLANLVHRKEPAEKGRVSVAGTVADRLLDDIFRQDANDLVVPTKGVYEWNGNPNFPIPEERIHRFMQSQIVTHVNFFDQPETAARLLEWLTG